MVRFLHRLKNMLLFNFKRPSKLFSFIIFIPFFYFLLASFRQKPASTSVNKKNLDKDGKLLEGVKVNARPTSVDLNYDTVFETDNLEHALRTVNFKNAFDEVLKTHCSPNDNKLMLKCINKINDLDNEIAVQRAKSVDFHPCHECLYDPENKEKSYFYYHTFWQIGPHSSHFYRRVLRLQILSFIATQNLCCSKMIVWKLSSFDSNLEKKLTKTFEKYIKSGRVQFKDVKLTELCKMKIRGHNSKEATGSSFADNKICQDPNDNQLNNKMLVSLSDFVRFFVLDLYGGIYVDGDVFYLKDLRMLFTFDFIYKWSYTDNYNTAVLGIRKEKNAALKRFYERSMKSCHSVESFISHFHPFGVTHNAAGADGANIYNYQGLKLLHSSIVDPAWLCNDGVIKLPKHTACGLADFNDQVTVDRKIYTPLDKTFYPGAFTFHIHLKNAGEVIRNGSFFEYFEEFWSKQLKLKLL